MTLVVVQLNSFMGKCKLMSANSFIFVKVYIATLKNREFGSSLEMLSFAVEASLDTVGVQFVKEYENKGIVGPRSFAEYGIIETLVN